MSEQLQEGKRIDRQRVFGADPNYWRVWVGSYCVADGVGRFHSWWLVLVLRRIL